VKFISVLLKKKKRISTKKRKLDSAVLLLQTGL
jgi:hypothetical protein